MAEGEGVHGERGAHCKGGHAWQRGACVAKRGVCCEGGIHGEGGVHGKGEHTWQRGDMHGKGLGACVVRGCMNLSKFGWLIIYTDIYLLARASNKCDK